MKAFMDEDFLLNSDTAKKLFHEYAEHMPIVDYHCHINPAEIAQNRKFDNITQAFSAYVKKLEEVSGVKIAKFDDVCEALALRLDYFEKAGCKASDHGLNAVVYAPVSQKKLDGILKAAMEGAPLTAGETDEYKYALLFFLAREYVKRGWVMQIHYGTARDVNTAMYEKLGPDTGFDCISPQAGGNGLIKFFDSLFRESSLPKTILYALNANDNLYIDSVIGCFQGTEAAGKLQHGAAWWFNDTKTGMLDQMTGLANLSALGNFVGMLTDSRSFLSYTRHDYFRRILCDLFGRWVENGEYPCDMKTLGILVQDISYYNVVRYFGLSL